MDTSGNDFTTINTTYYTIRLSDAAPAQAQEEEEPMDERYYTPDLGVALEGLGWRYDPDTGRVRNDAGAFTKDPLERERRDAYAEKLAKIREEVQKRAREEQERLKEGRAAVTLKRLHRTLAAITARRDKDLPALLELARTIRPATIAETEKYLDEVRVSIAKRTEENTRRSNKKKRALFKKESELGSALVIRAPNLTTVMPPVGHATHTTPSVSLVGINKPRLAMREDSQETVVSVSENVRSVGIVEESAQAWAEGRRSLFDLQTVGRVGAAYDLVGGVRSIIPQEFATHVRPRGPSGALGAVYTEEKEALNLYPTPEQYAELLVASNDLYPQVSANFCYGAITQSVMPMLAYAPVVQAMLDERLRGVSQQLRARYVLPTMLVQREGYHPEDYDIVGLHGQRFGIGPDAHAATGFYCDPAWAVFVGNEKKHATIVIYLDEALDFISAAVCQVDALTNSAQTKRNMNHHAPLTGAGQLYTLETWLGAGGAEKYDLAVLPPPSRASAPLRIESLSPERIELAYECVRATEAPAGSWKRNPHPYWSMWGSGRVSTTIFPGSRLPDKATAYMSWSSEQGAWPDHVLVVTDPGTAQESYYWVDRRQLIISWDLSDDQGHPAFKALTKFYFPKEAK